MNKFMMSVVGLLLTVGAQAQWSNKGIKFQAKIKYVSNGELLNLSGASVNVRILSPNDCVLWEENHAGQNITNGYLSLVVGSGTTQGAHPAGTTLKAVFDNTTNRSGLVCVDGTNAPTANTAYHPMANDIRKVRISFNNGVDSVLADFSLRASGYALNSETLDGKSVSDFVLKAATAWPATCATGEFVSSVSATGAVTCSPIGAVAGAVSSVAGRTGAITLSTSDISGLGAAALMGVGTTAGTVAAGNDVRFTQLNGVAVSPTAPTTNQVLQFNGTQYVPVALPSAPVTSVSGRTGAVTLTTSDIFGLGGASILNVGTAAGTVAAGDDARFTKLNGVAVSATAPSSNGQVLTWNNTTSQWEPTALPVTSVPVTSVAGRTGAIVLSNTDISGLGGAAILNVGTAASTVAAGNDSRIVGALQSSVFNSAVASANCTSSQTMYWNSVSSQFLCQAISVASSTNFSGSLAGDVTGTQSATVVGKIRGVAVAATAPTANQVLQYDGSQYVPTSLPADAVTSVAGKTGVVTLASTDISGLGDSATLNVGSAAGTVAAGNDPRFLPAGTNAGDMLYYNGTNWTSDPFMTRKMSRKITDFSGTTIPAGLTASASSGTCSANAAAYAGYFGVLRCSTGTITTGWTSVNNGVSELKTGKAIFHKQTIVIPTLSVAAQRFNIRAGLSSAGTTGNADPAAGVYLRYSDSVNSGRFQCVSRNASVESAVDTGVTVVAGTIYELEVRINAAANQVNCFVNGVAAGTITTNVPATSNSMGIFTNIQKTAGTTTLNVDVLDWETVIVK